MSESDRFTNQKRRVMSEAEFGSKWGCRVHGGKNFCALCNHTFRVGDGWRWVYANGPKPEGQHSFGNFSVCDLCDGPDVLERYQAACFLIYASVHDRGEGHWPVNIAANLLTAHGEQENLQAQLAAKDAQLGAWLKQNGPGGWIDDLRRDVAAKDAVIRRLSEALHNCMISIGELAQRSEDEDCNEFTDSVNAHYKAAAAALALAAGRGEQNEPK